ncbi:MAG: MBOAT family O-acyltransferase [Anaerolineae bacterium]|jgi:D-alanyl-lipoteichoic acid acyltransferase DltB (MBOAT superfamily)|nr:MBOAT family O-acyltransferase [Anaerolineae bacterium]
MKKSISSTTILQLLLCMALAALFAWTLVWRIPNFAVFLRQSKLIWFGSTFLLLGGLFLWRRKVCFDNLALLFQRKDAGKDIQRNRLWVYLLIGLSVMILFTLHSDYFDLRFPLAVRLENTASTPVDLEALCPTDDQACFPLNTQAAAQGLAIQEQTVILHPGQVLEFETNFFFPPFRQPQAYLVFQGESLLAKIGDVEHTIAGSAEPVLFPLAQGQTLSRTWQLILLLNIATLILSSLVLPFLLIPAEILDAKKIKSFRFHILMLALILMAMLVALADDLTRVPAHTPINGLVDAFGWDWMPTLSFNSYLTYLFVGLVLLVYYLVKPVSRWLVLLIASYVFLFSFDPFFVAILLVVTVISYLTGKAIHASEDAEARKKAFNRGALSTLGMLLFFKYAPLLWSSAGVWVGADAVWKRILLPLGISFYIFTALSYLKDVQTGKAPAELHFGKFALYLAYFPKILIGPIERPNAFLAQLQEEHRFDEDRFVIALSRIGMGLAKRLLVSNRLAVIADAAFSNPAAFTSPELAVGLLAFTFQVYVDFSAYTDIAIGISALFGIQLTENFQQPYFATSIVDFWRRWHISFSSWLRDYVFLPLEFESRRVRTKSMQYFNTLITFLISGMWHGATINFLLWGGMHGLYQVGEDLLTPQQAKDVDSNVVTKLRKILVTFVLVALAWVFFRADTLQSALGYFESLFNLRTIFQFSTAQFVLDAQDFWLVMGLLPIIVLLDLLQRKHDLLAEIYAQPLLIRWVIYLLVIFGSIIFGFYGSYDVDFVYMQF